MADAILEGFRSVNDYNIDGRELEHVNMAHDHVDEQEEADKKRNSVQAKFVTGLTQRMQASMSVEDSVLNRKLMDAMGVRKYAGDTQAARDRSRARIDDKKKAREKGESEPELKGGTPEAGVQGGKPEGQPAQGDGKAGRVSGKVDGDPFDVRVRDAGGRIGRRSFYRGNKGGNNGRRLPQVPEGDGKNHGQKENSGPEFEPGGP